MTISSKHPTTIPPILRPRLAVLLILAKPSFCIERWYKLYEISACPAFAVGPLADPNPDAKNDEIVLNFICGSPFTSWKTSIGSRVLVSLRFVFSSFGAEQCHGILGVEREMANGLLARSA
jgi:hypothetical protein